MRPVRNPLTVRGMGPSQQNGGGPPLGLRIYLATGCCMGGYGERVGA
jgi:hypothetical protein